MSLKDPYILLLSKLSDVRHMMGVVTNQRFKTLYAGASFDEQEKILKWLHTVDRFELDSWINKHRSIEDLSIRELRVKAAANQIPCYSRMDKATLLKEIKACSIKQ